MKTFILILAIALMGITTFARNKNKTGIKKQQTIVIVPGAWTARSMWAYVIPSLKAKGFDVIAVTLQGHGFDTTSFANITSQS